ncbi:MAG: prolipoprotein diacylglyceryl transferase [Planctomycetaceae bacterium]|nr:prolipoprotein diacylglyceryl transferase [Planctomycetaceae bacterium]
MRQTLFHIPDTLFGLPVFGWGLGLAVLLAIVLLSHAWQYFKHRKITDVGHSVAMLAIGSVLLVFILPYIAEEDGIPIRGYGFCLLVAVLFAFFLVRHLAIKQGISVEKVYSLCIWTVVFGIIGARIFFVTEYWEDIRRVDEAGRFLPVESLLNVLNFTQGGLVVFGSIIGGILTALIFMRLNGMPILRTFDIMAPAVALGIAIGRIGCLLNGCCFGSVSNTSWAITFPLDSPAHHYQVVHGLVLEPLVVLPVHPTQIYSSFLAFLLCGVLLFLGRTEFYRQREGLVLATFMMLYSLGRFFIEIVRTDEAPFFGTGMTISQNVSIAFGLAGIALFVYLCNRKSTGDDTVNPRNGGR